MTINAEATSASTARDHSVTTSRLARERMLMAMRVLETALAKASPRREAAWRRTVVAALNELEKAMQRQADELNSPDGLLADILREQPRLEKRIEMLCRQHEDLVRHVGFLRNEFAAEDQDHPLEVADVRQRISWLLTALRHFQSRETDLIYEAIQRDIGEVD